MTHGVDLDDVMKLCSDAHPISLKPGDILFREGDEAESMYIVKSGLLRILSGSTMYETVGPGGLIGEMAIVEEHIPRSATVIAGTYAELSDRPDVRCRRLRAQLNAISCAGYPRVMLESRSLVRAPVRRY